MELLLKYKPKTTKDIIGNKKIYDKLTNDLKQNKHRGIYVLSGPKGTGKSSFVKAYCKANKYKLISTTYDQVMIQHIVKTFMKKALLIEIPFLNKKADIKKAMKQLRKSFVPIFIIAPEYKSTLFKGSKSYKMKEIGNKEIMIYLNNVIKGEEITFANKIISKKLVEGSAGDIRKLILNLELLISNKKNVKYTKGTLAILDKTHNDIVFKDNIYENIYKGDDHRRTNVFFSDQFIVQNVIYENAPMMQTTISNIADFYESITCADILTQNQNQTQDYSHLPYIAYINSLATTLCKAPRQTPRYPGLFMKLYKKGSKFNTKIGDESILVL